MALGEYSIYHNELSLLSDFICRNLPQSLDCIITRVQWFNSGHVTVTLQRPTCKGETTLKLLQIDSIIVLFLSEAGTRDRFWFSCKRYVHSKLNNEYVLGSVKDGNGLLSLLTKRLNSASCSGLLPTAIHANLASICRYLPA